MGFIIIKRTRWKNEQIIDKVTYREIINIIIF
jgi:hypothetical protein